MAILWLESATILSLFFWSVRCQMFMENPGPVRPFDNLDARLHGTLRVQDGICLNHYSLKKGSVVQVSNSEKLGGRLLNATTGLTAEACLTRCCQLDPCTVAAFEQQVCTVPRSRSHHRSKFTRCLQKNVGSVFRRYAEYECDWQRKRALG